MSIQMLAQELYRLLQKVEKIEKQLENARRMQASGEMPVMPGMELLSRPEKSGAPPI